MKYLLTIALIAMSATTASAFTNRQLANAPDAYWHATWIVAVHEMCGFDLSPKAKVYIRKNKIDNRMFEYSVGQQTKGYNETSYQCENWYGELMGPASEVGFDALREMTQPE